MIDALKLTALVLTVCLAFVCLARLGVILEKTEGLVASQARTLVRVDALERTPAALAAAAAAASPAAMPRVLARLDALEDTAKKIEAESYQARKALERADGKRDLVARAANSIEGAATSLRDVSECLEGIADVGPMAPAPAPAPRRR